VANVRSTTARRLVAPVAVLLVVGLTGPPAAARAAGPIRGCAGAAAVAEPTCPGVAGPGATPAVTGTVSTGDRPGAVDVPDVGSSDGPSASGDTGGPDIRPSTPEAAQSITGGCLDGEVACGGAADQAMPDPVGRVRAATTAEDSQVTVVRKSRSSGKAGAPSTPPAAANDYSQTGGDPSDNLPQTGGGDPSANLPTTGQNVVGLLVLSVLLMLGGVAARIGARKPRTARRRRAG
jgi:hypothetical protein